jgi:DcmR-like sensory protein
MGRKDWYYVHFPKLLIKRLDQFLQTPRAKSMGMSSKPELLRHVINQFLDEQEALYKMENIGDVILEMEDRDHIVFTYNNESQFREILNAYVRRGVNRNQMNVMLIYAKEQQKFVDSIDRIEIVNFLFNSQDIMIIPADEGFYDDGSFSIIPILNRIRDIVVLSKRNSKDGLNVLATMPTKLIEQERYEDALHLENISNNAIKEIEISVTMLCLYKTVPENLEARFSEYHDLIIRRSASMTSTGLQ